MLQGPHNVTSFQIANCNIMGSGTVIDSLDYLDILNSQYFRLSW